MYVDYDHHDTHDEQESIRTSLRKAIGFTDSDLVMNKSGKLSTRQMIRLMFQVLGPFAGLLASAAGLVALGILLFMAGPVILSRFRLMLRLGKYLTAGIGTLFFGLVAFIIRLILTSGRVAQFMLDLMQGNVTSTVGRMSATKSEEIEDGLSTLTRQKTETFNCVVKGEYFAISEEAFEILQECSGGIYRAYMTPRSRFLVALEPATGETGGRDPFKLEYNSGNR
ncbi:MAG TPA: hypothetical protein VGL53_10800 [Bryobacteraceae bacterium]|jgi:hypothetical protein